MIPTTKRTFTAGGLYFHTSRRNNSPFKMLLRLCTHAQPGKPLELFFEDFSNGSLHMLLPDWKQLSPTTFEVESTEHFNIEEVSTDIKSFISHSANRINSMI